MEECGRTLRFGRWKMIFPEGRGAFEWQIRCIQNVHQIVSFRVHEKCLTLERESHHSNYSKRL
jgi:hypothetical protein